MRTVLQDSSSEVLYDEVDLVDGMFVHRVLFDSHREWAVTFRDLIMSRTPAISRVFKPGVSELHLGGDS